MKLDQYSLVFEVDDKKFRDFQIEYTRKLMSQMSNPTPSNLKVGEDKIRYWSEGGFRKLVFSGKSVDNLENYKVPKDIRIDVLKSLPNRKDIIQLDELRCVRYMKTDTEVFFSIHQRKSPVTRFNIDEKTHTFYMGINLETGFMSIDNMDTLSKESITWDKVIEDFYGLFMVVVTYLELTPISLSIVKGGKKRGDIMKNNILKNESKSSVIQVNSNWNTKVIRTDSFGVRGHHRLQPHGKGRKEYKWIYIEPYEKGIMRRLPQKELVN
jgi:hypothetical protein